MPIEDLAHRYRELGRLKFGEDLGDRPTQLNTWRLTSPDAHLIEAAAQLWGGVPSHDQTASGALRASVITETSELEILVPPQDVSAGQFYELWKAGGLERRCTGTALITFDDSPAGYSKVAPCICEDENSTERACKISTTLRVLLPQLPDIGVWRLHTGSYYAATEIPATVEILQRIAGPTGLAPAVLALEQRSSKKRGSARHDYIIPTLRSRQSLEALMASPTPAGLTPLPFDAGEREGVTDSLPASPARTPSLPPSEPPDGPEPASGPESPQRPPPGSTEATEALWRDLRDFLELTPPGDAPHDREVLIEILAELERLALATGLWRGDPLDAASNRYLRGRYWKGDQIDTEELRTFAQRALMAAATDLDKHPLASRYIARPNTEQETT